MQPSLTPLALHEVTLPRALKTFHPFSIPAHLKTGTIDFVSQTSADRFSGVLYASHVERLARQIIDAHQKDFNGAISLSEIGRSRGNNLSQAPQPISVIDILPAGHLDGVAIFCAGHHGPEYAGPHANLHLLNLVLSELTNPQSKLKELLGRKAISFLPLVNPDGAMLKEDNDFESLKFFGARFDEQGYSYDNNIYITWREGEKLAPETAFVKAYIEEQVRSFGPISLAFDFHESNLITQDGAADKRQNRYVFAPLEIATVTLAVEQNSVNYEMRVMREVIDQAIELFGEVISPLIIRGKPKESIMRANQEYAGLAEYAKLLGANSFLVETPGSDRALQVGERVVLTMLAVQNIFNSLLARKTTS